MTVKSGRCFFIISLLKLDSTHNSKIAIAEIPSIDGFPKTKAQRKRYRQAGEITVLPQQTKDQHEDAFKLGS